MIPQDLARQIDRWLDDDLSDDEQASLQAGLDNTPDALDYLCHRAILDQLLSKSHAGNLAPSPKLLTIPRRKRIQSWVWVSSVAVICLILFSMQLLPKVTASPVELVRKTLIAYRVTVDRCYNVSVELENRPLRSRFARRSPPSDSKLWVRGKSFVQKFDAASGPLIWGKNNNGDVWFTVSGKSAAIFEANEIPEVLQDVCELRTLELTTLLESLLRDYSLECTDRKNGIHTIVAHRRPESGPAKYGAIEIEIQADSKLIRHVTIERLNDQRLVAVVHFTLDQVQQISESYYDLQTHVQADSPIYDRATRFGRRSELLKEFLQNLRFPQPSNNN